MLSEERETMRCTNIAMHTNKPVIWDGMHISSTSCKWVTNKNERAGEVNRMIIDRI